MKSLACILFVTTLAAADPPPDQASGVETEDQAPARRDLLWIPRTVLFVPRAVIWAGSQPIRAGAWAFEKYELREYFFSDTGDYGVYPVARYESRYGFTAGARFVHYDLFGEGERLRLRADFGGRFHQAYGVRATTGHRLGRVTFDLDASYEVRGRERFYGIGNTASNMFTEFHEDAFRNVLMLDLTLPYDFVARTSGALMVRDLSGDVPMTGFEDGVQNIYVEEELAYDSRRPASSYESAALDGTGWLVSGHVGYTHGVSGDRSSFGTYGGEIQRYFDLYEGSRVLALRVLAESITGNAISFVDLPRLGGSEYLRGYPLGRFRDRALALASIEYAWDIGNYVAAYTFVDAGRVYHSFQDADLSNIRVGYGGGIQVHTLKSFLMRVQLAASRDGDVIFDFALSPAFGRRERAGRF